MRLTFLYPIPLLALLACSDDNSSDEGNGGSSTAGSAGSAGSSSNSGGSAGSSSSGGSDSSGGSSGSSNTAGTANNGGSAGAPGNGSADCMDVCERSLDCEMDDPAECLDSCETAAELCPTEAAAAQACALPRPDSDFHCEDGETTINDGVCETETTNLALCIFTLGGL